MTSLYLAVLLVSLAGLGYLDFRHKLVVWHHRRAALVTLMIGVAAFLIWDLAGITLGIFYPGNSAFTLGILLAPGLPLEELFFLSLLCYLTLILWPKKA